MGNTTNNVADAQAVQQFIAFWRNVGTSEMATAQSFVSGLCTLLNMPHPKHELDYMFERPITFRHGDGSSSAGRIDCYRRGHFVLETKKLKHNAPAKGFDDSLLRARAQAEGYARALPATEGRGPWKKSLPRILETLQALGRAPREGESWRS